MFCRTPRTISKLTRIFTAKIHYNSSALYSAEPSLTEVPKKPKRSERKPWVTDINALKRQSRLIKQHETTLVREIKLKPPENGLLVKELIPVARSVLAARTRLLSCVSQLVDKIPVHVCSVCGDVHVGDPPHEIRTCDVRGSKKSKEHTWEKGGVDDILPVVESFHLYDRLGRAVTHNERLLVDRIPAIVELCVQAGVEILEYPTRRRDFPVYRVAGKIIDFEKKFPKNDFSRKEINTSGFWEMVKKSNGDEKRINLPCNDIKVLAIRGMEAFEKLRIGVTKLMEKYAVQTCGYCSEVQVGPKGHRVRQCQAFKHQMRDGQHAWQEATFDDLFPPVYVWHVTDPHNPLLVDALKRYYGKLPAVVELLAQGGAEVGEYYRCVMRDGVVVPGLDEEKLVV